MRLLHIITDLRTGGAEHLMVHLLPHLRSLGHHVSLLCFDGTPTPFMQALQASGIEVHSLSRSRRMYSPVRLWQLVRYLRQHPADVVHVHNTPPQLLAALASLVLKLRLFTTEHNTHNRRRHWPGVRLIDRWLYSRFEQVVCVSQPTEHNLLAYLGKCHCHTCTVPNGVPLEAYRNAQPAADVLQTSPDAFKVVMVASLTTHKDHHTLLRAMALLPERFHLFLAGDGPLRATLEALCRDLHIAGRVHFLGIRHDVPSLLAAAHAVVLSSHSEGLSLASVEGMASGRPFVASCVDGLREVVEGGGILVPHADAQALAQALQRLHDDPAYAEQVAKQGIERANRYSMPRMAQAYHRLYQTAYRPVHSP